MSTSASILTPGLRPAAKLMKALFNEARLLILCELGQGECSVGQLGKIVGLSQSALSQQLTRLRLDGLVRTRRRSQTIFYSRASREVTAIIGVLADLFRHAPEAPGGRTPSCGAAVTDSMPDSMSEEGTGTCRSGPGSRSE
ncbi:ArsR/SmtB family transcription factor [Azospirillum largimobile]